MQRGEQRLLIGLKSILGNILENGLVTLPSFGVVVVVLI